MAVDFAANQGDFFHRLQRGLVYHGNAYALHLLLHSLACRVPCFGKRWSLWLWWVSKWPIQALQHNPRCWFAMVVCQGESCSMIYVLKIPHNLSMTLWPLYFEHVSLFFFKFILSKSGKPVFQTASMASLLDTYSAKESLMPWDS